MTRKRYRKLSKRQKELAFSAIDFYVQRVMPRMAKSLSIKILGDDTLCEREGIEGDCDYIDVESRYPREFEIRVDTKQSERDFVATIIHEMVHVKQWARKEMWDVKGNVFTRSWKGDIISIDDLDYMDHPWEIEAYKYQYVLTDEFLVLHMHH